MDEAGPSDKPGKKRDSENNIDKTSGDSEEIDDEIEKEKLDPMKAEKDSLNDDEVEDGDIVEDAFHPMVGNLQDENENLLQEDQVLGPGGLGGLDHGLPPGDEIVIDHLLHQENPFAQPPPVIDFNQLDNALQHVQGHMDNMMHNLGGLQSSVKHLKQNLSHYMRSSEVDRNALRVSLNADIVQSWRDGTFSDLILVDDAGINHKVHKVVLASRSSYFRAQLTNWDKDEKVLHVKIVSSEILKIVIEFIYTLDVQKQITTSNVVDLLQAANIYDLKLLREECVHFLKHRISVTNIIEVLSFSHIDPKLEVHATNFLARNFSKFLTDRLDRKTELMELPVDKMKMVLRSKMLILRDKHMFPIKAVVREGAILRFVLEYIQFRPRSRLTHAGDLLFAVKFHLLPLDPSLEFPSNRFLPNIVLNFIQHELSSGGFKEVRERLDQIETDVRFLHVGSDRKQLYQNTFSNLVYVSVENMVRTYHRKAEDREETAMNDRNPGWDACCNREASLCHEWWTAHAHDSRFVPCGNSRNTKIVAVSGSADGQKFIKRLTFHVGDVNDNHDLLPEWFHLAPQYSIQNMQQELGEYIGALHVVWSNGKENWLGRPGPDLSKSRTSVVLEEGEHIIKSYQLFWGPRQVFVPLEVVDFVFVTNKGRKFGPFTKQVRKLYLEAKGQKKDWSFTDIRHKLNSKSIQRRVDNPLLPMCRPASIGELSSSSFPDSEDDLSWSVWLDGFLCVTKNEKIIRITLKFAVYLDCLYQEKKKPKCVSGRRSGKVAPVLLNYTLDQLRENIVGRPVRIQDYEYLWDNMMTPYADPEDESGGPDRSKRMRKMLEWNERGLGREVESDQEEEDGIAAGEHVEEGQEEDEAHEGGLEVEAEAVELNVDQDLLEDPVPVQDNEDNNNNDEENGEQEEADEEEGENDHEGDHLHGDVWDALINDDLRAIGQLYEKRAVKIEEYLE